MERKDLSPYLVHLTRDYNGVPAQDNLVSILSAGRIEARNSYGIAVAHLRGIGCGGPEFLESQRVACFSETPPDQLPGLLDPGIWRRYQFRPYGVAFRREAMLNRGANPVWYLNSYRGDGFRWLAHDINKLIDEAALDPEGDPDAARFQESAIARVTPFMEVIGEWPSQRGIKRKDFTFEREWRVSGPFSFSLLEVAVVLVPAGMEDVVRQRLAAAGVPRAVLNALRFHALPADREAA